MSLVKTVMDQKKLAGENATEYIRDGMTFCEQEAESPLK